MTPSHDPFVPAPRLGALAHWAGRWRWLVILVWLGIAAGSVWLAATRLGIDTGTTEMIDAAEPFRQDSIAFRTAFPALDDVLLAVIDGPSPEAADAAAMALVDRLAPLTDLFGSVTTPAADPFFRQNGLLYRDTATLTALSDRVAEAQPLLISLAEDPSLGGLFDLLIDAVDAAGSVEETGIAVSAALPAFFDAIAAEVERAVDGQPGQLSWRGVLADGDPAVTRTRAFVLAQPLVDTRSLALARDGIAAVHQAVADLGLADRGVTVRLTGEPALDTAELATVSRGAVMAGVLSFVLVSALLVLGLGSLRLIVAVLATLIVGLLTTAGFATLAIGSLNLISVAFAVLFVGLAVDFGIHVALRYRERAGDGPAVAVRQALGGVGPALALASLCAGIGFLSFAPTAYRGLAELGVISAGGMAVALAANVTLMPALLSALGAVRPAPSLGGGARVYAWAIGPARRGLLGVAVAATAGAAVVAPFVKFDVNPLNLQDPGLEAVATYRDLAGDPDTSPYAVQVLAPDLEAAAVIADTLRAVPDVGRVLSIASFVPPDQDARLAIIDTMALFLTPLLLPFPPDEPSDTGVGAVRRALATVPADDPLLGDAAARLDAALAAFETRIGTDDAARATLSDRLVGTLPGWLDDLATALQPAPITGVDALPPSITDRWIGVDGQIRVEATPAGDVTESAAMRAFAQSVLATVERPTGAPVVLTRASDTVIAAFYQATGLTILGIIAVLVVIQRRFDDVVLTLVPLLIAAVWTLAAAAALGLAFNLANVIVLPLLFGLGVASSIHLVTRRRQALGGGASVTQSSTPRAVLFSALTTVASFGSLAVSPHRGMASMGLLLTVAIVAVLLATLVVLPCLMAEWDARRARRARRTA